jgi:riboflavin kinase/FMN adenylyltransferase
MKFTGVVKKGAGRGKDLGFPTANIEPPEGLDVVEGIYFGRLIGAPSLVFIGAAETFGETEKKVEVYVLGFGGDLYGQEVEVEIEKFLRPNVKFTGKDELVAQMKKDEQDAREYFRLPDVI